MLEITRYWWYSQVLVLAQICDELKQKELAFLSKAGNKPIRNLFSHNSEDLRYKLEHEGILADDSYNLYHSLASFGWIPLIKGGDLAEREVFKATFRQYLIGYDYGVDIDAEKLGDALKTALFLKNLFDKYKLPYSVKFSGMRGFHFLIKSHYLPKKDSWDSLIAQLAEITYNLRGIYDLNIDAGITDIRRVWKCPYSWDRGNICLPLSDSQLKSFSLDLVKPETVWSDINLVRRGLLERTWGLTEIELQQNVNNFVRDYK